MKYSPKRRRRSYLVGRARNWFKVSINEKTIFVPSGFRHSKKSFKYKTLLQKEFGFIIQLEMLTNGNKEKGQRPGVPVLPG